MKLETIPETKTSAFSCGSQIRSPEAPHVGWELEERELQEAGLGKSVSWFSDSTKCWTLWSQHLTSTFWVTEMILPHSTNTPTATVFKQRTFLHIYHQRPCFWIYLLSLDVYRFDGCNLTEAWKRIVKRKMRKFSMFEYRCLDSIGWLRWVDSLSSAAVMYMILSRGVYSIRQELNSKAIGQCITHAH